MKLYPYPKSERRPDGGFTSEEVNRGLIWLRADVTCTVCGKEQSAANAGSIVNGTCVRCGGLTK